MSERTKDTIIRFSLIFGLIALGFLLVIGKIIYTQYFDSERWLAVAQRQVHRNEVIQPNRGNIYDCDGRLLAGSAASYYIRMDTRVPWLHEKDGLHFNEYIDSVSFALSDYFGDRSEAEYKRLITTAYHSNESRLLLQPRRITYTQLRAVQQMPLFNLGRYKSGLLIDTRYRRVKPYGSLASRSIGNIYGENGKGIAGLEKRFEEELHGVEGKKVIEMIDNRVVAIEDVDAIDGMDIVTTIDANLQDVVEVNLRNTLERLKADWGCCVLMEVSTGKIRAISNLGRVDDQYIENRNYAVSRIEPGSTFKTYSLMAAIDDGKVTITDTLDVEKGLWHYENAEIRDSHAYRDKKGTLLTKTRFTVKEILAASSNVGLAKIVTSAYDKKAEKFVDKLTKMGICDSVYSEIPGKTQPRIDVPKDNVTLSRMSFGYSVELAPVDIMMFYNAIANNGKMIRPYIVSEVQKGGHSIKRFGTETVKNSICKSSTLRDIRECLEAVVWSDYSNSQVMGTAALSPWGSKKARSNIVHIAGKTGTAQILDNGNYKRHQHRTLFCGYFPMEAPQYTCICVIQQKEYAEYDAGMDCGGTVRRIAERVMAYNGNVNLSTKISTPKDSILLPPIKRGMQSDIQTTTHQLNIKVSSTTDAQWARVNDKYELQELNVNKVIVPNVIGMGAKDAVFAMENAGMLVKLKGKGKVTYQSVQAGQPAVQGVTVFLELK